MVNNATPSHTTANKNRIMRVGVMYMAVGTDSSRPAVIPKKKIDDRYAARESESVTFVSRL